MELGGLTGSNGMIKKTPAVILSASVIFLQGVFLPSARAVSIVSSSPGNLFVAGEAPRFVLEGRGRISFECLDFWDESVASGELETAEEPAALELPKLPPGWYSLRCRDDQGSVATTLGVVVRRKDGPLSVNGRIGVDAASSWLVKNESLRKPLAEIVRMAGIPWVRERISWSATEPQKGLLIWKRYQSTLDAFREQGIHVDQMWHDAPRWTHPRRPEASTPDDLRDAYQWVRAAAAHFSDSISAWEIWNEMDLPSFWSDTGDRFAAMQKACYWGVKDGDPAALVIMGSLATNPPGNFASNICEAGISDYYDRFNWHIYTDPSTYREGLLAHERLQQSAGAQVRPAWVTEAGVLISGKKGADKRLLDSEGQEAQARYASRSVVQSLAAGNERHFFFVLPDYLENGVQFGVLRSDLTPNPAFLALSAAANLIGESRHVGNLSLGEGIHAVCFTTEAGAVTAVWADRETEVTLPVTDAEAGVANIFGARKNVTAKDGTLSFTVGPEMRYLLTADVPLRDKVTDSGERGEAGPEPHPSRLVLCGTFDLSCSKESNTYQLGAVPAEGLKFKVEVYNFDPVKTHAGEIGISLPEGWMVSPETLPCTVPPMERVTLDFVVRPAGEKHLEVKKVSAAGRFSGENVAPSVSYIQTAPAFLPPTGERPLDWMPAARWKPNVTEIGTVVTSDTGNGLKIAADFSGNGDRWAYPSLEFSEPLDLSGYDGIAFDLGGDAPTPNSWMRILLKEKGGSIYMGGTQDVENPHRVVLLFKDMKWMGFSPTDANGSLDLSRIIGVQIGVNTPGDHMAIKVENLKAVKFGEDGQP